MFVVSEDLVGAPQVVIRKSCAFAPDGYQFTAAGDSACPLGGARETFVQRFDDCLVHRLTHAFGKSVRELIGFRMVHGQRQGKASSHIVASRRPLGQKDGRRLRAIPPIWLKERTFARSRHYVFLAQTKIPSTWPNFCAVYTRQSSRAEGDYTSCDTQGEICTAFAESRGFRILGHFADVGLSGAGLDRPELQRLLDFVRRGLVRAVAVHGLIACPAVSWIAPPC